VGRKSQVVFGKLDGLASLATKFSCWLRNAATLGQLSSGKQ
jgi:hypothetical protein